MDNRRRYVEEYGQGNLPPAEIFSAGRDLRYAASKAARRGGLRRIVQGVYTRDLTTPLEMLVRTRLLEIVAAARPGALIADRSATLWARSTGDNLLFVVHQKQPDVRLPGGIVIRSRQGVGPLPSDLALPHGLYQSSEARCALENMVESRSRGGRTARTLSRRELELWLDRQVSRRGDDWARPLRDEIRELAPTLRLEPEAETLDGLLGALLGTRTVPVVSPELTARMRGAGFDSARVATFDRLLLDFAQRYTRAARLHLAGERSGRAHRDEQVHRSDRGGQPWDPTHCSLQPGRHNAADLVVAENPSRPHRRATMLEPVSRRTWKR